MPTRLPLTRPRKSFAVIEHLWFICSGGTVSSFERFVIILILSLRQYTFLYYVIFLLLNRPAGAGLMQLSRVENVCEWDNCKDPLSSEYGVPGTLIER